jgi:hypothetical protein
MVGITALWLPILLSAVFVFVASAIIHMGLRYHRTDFTAVPGEDKVRAAMRDEGVGPGNYHFPYACGMGELKNPDVIAKFKEGPVGLLTVMPSGPPAMGKNLMQWFIYTVIASVLVAYVTGRTLGAPEMEHDHQERHRWTGLRAPDRGHFRLALVELIAGGRKGSSLDFIQTRRGPVQLTLMFAASLYEVKT